MLMYDIPQELIFPMHIACARLEEMEDESLFYMI